MRIALLLFLVVFLSPQPARAAVAAPPGVSATQLIDSGGCRGCHRIAGRGGSLGAALDGVGKRLGRERLRRQLLAARQANPGSAVPSYDHLSPAELELLLDYLAQLQ